MYIATLSRQLEDKLERLLTAYSQTWPQAKLFPAGFYLFHPGFANGKNALCVLDDKQNLVGFAPLFPKPFPGLISEQRPHRIWLTLVIAPGQAASSSIRDLLWQALSERLAKIAPQFPPGPIQLAAECSLVQREEIKFLQSRGFRIKERVLRMERHLVAEPRLEPTPSGVKIEVWRLDTPRQRQAYLRAENAAFPHAPRSAESLQVLLDSPDWEQGGAVCALDERGRVVGSVLTYCAGDEGVGCTEDVFVLPAWRNRGLAKAMLSRALAFLCQRGVSRARLEVLEDNQAAVRVYQSQGFAVTDRQAILECDFQQ